MADPLDELDRQIVDRLKRNGREPAASIAKRVSLSPTAVQRRIDRLERQGIIKGYTVAIDYDQFVATVDAYIALSVADGTNVDALMREMIARPEVREVVALAGDPDALLRVRVASTAELGRLAKELRAIRHVRGTKTHVVIGRLWHGAEDEPG